MMKKSEKVAKPSESYLSPAMKTVEFGCEGLLCSSIENMYPEDEIFPDGFKFI